MRMELIFSECEHHGDMDNYMSDVIESGGKILKQELNTEEETCKLEVVVSDSRIFLERMSKTDSNDFIINLDKL